MTPTRVSISAIPWVATLAAAYFVLHLPFLAPSLEDIDSINFALGLHHFDIVQHQPHPPGYPVYILMGRLSLWVLSAVTSMSAVRIDAVALAIWSAIGGAVAVGGAARLFAAVEQRFGDERANPVWPVALLAAAPLFWMCGLRPMSDMPGLAAVLWSQALLVEGTKNRRSCVAGALLAGIGAGIRIQTLALTTPLLLLAVIYQRRAGVWWLVSRVGGACLGGSAMWAAPLLAASGGLSSYLAALNTQAGEDFAWVNMLWSNPTPRQLAFALYETFVLPWASLPLAVLVATAGLAGAVTAIVRTPRAATVMLLAFGPYVVYHMLFQETLTVRYALPVTPLIVWFAARGAIISRRASAVVALLVAWSFLVAVAGGVAYGREAHPAYRAMEEALRRTATEAPARVYAHFGLRRSLQHGGTALPFVEPRREYEWLGPSEYWRQGGRAPVWFFGDPRRTDLALIDPTSRRDVVRYGWAAAGRQELSGTRPTGVDWYLMAPPGWFAGEGWSLTPEAGGMTHAAQSGLDHRPIEAWIRRRDEPVQMMVGGIHLGEPGDRDAELRLFLDGTLIDTWVLTRAEQSFLRFITLPAGKLAGASPYATLRIESDPGGGRRPEVAIRQFDAQPLAGVVFGFGAGWHEAEYTVETGARWRWTSERSVLQLRGTAQALRLTLTGESPLKYFDSPPTVRVTSEGRMLREFTPDADFEVTIDVPADVWRDGAASIAIESDRVYLPGQEEGTADQRHLGLRLFDTRIDTTLP